MKESSEDMQAGGRPVSAALKMLVFAAALCVVWLAYPKTPSSWFHGDDFSHLYEGRQSESAAGLAGFFLPGNSPGYYRPLDKALDVAQYALFGTRAVYYHLFSMIFYALNALVFFMLIYEWSGGAAVAAAAGLLFLAMPVHVETVAWAVCRNMLLSALFYLLSMLFFLRRMRGRKGAWTLWAALCFIPSVMFYDGGFSLPVMWVCMAAIVVSGEEGAAGKACAKDAIRALAVPIGVAAAYSFFYFAVLRAGFGLRLGQGLSRNFNVYMHDMAWRPYNHEIFVRFFLKLSPDGAGGGTTAYALEMLVWLLAAAVLARISRKGAGMLGLCWMIAGIAPFVTVYSERYAYFSSFGFCLVAAAGFEGAVSRVRNNRIRKALGGACIAALALVCAALINMDRERTAVWAAVGETNRAQMEELNKVAGPIGADEELAVVASPIDYLYVPGILYYGRALDVIYGNPAADRAVGIRNLSSITAFEARLDIVKAYRKKLKVVAFCSDMPPAGHFDDVTGLFDFTPAVKLKPGAELRIRPNPPGEGTCKSCATVLDCGSR